MRASAMVFFIKMNNVEPPHLKHIKLNPSKEPRRNFIANILVPKKKYNKHHFPPTAAGSPSGQIARATIPAWALRLAIATGPVVPNPIGNQTVVDAWQRP
jgi:hypothetical protein